MGTLAPKQSQSAKSEPSSLAAPRTIMSDRDRRNDLLVDRDAVLGYPWTERSRHSDADLPDEESSGRRPPRFSWSIERISIHPIPRPAIQTKLTVNQPGDIYEQEADRIANQVTRVPAPAAIQLDVKSISSSLQLKTAVQADFEPTAAPPGVEEVLRAPGQSLDAATRTYMDLRFGHDFSCVRIHSGSAAAQSAKELHAKAYTSGNNIVFDSGRYTPGTAEGDRLLAHELTHTIQQTGGRRASGHRGKLSHSPQILIQRAPATPDKPAASSTVTPKSPGDTKPDRGDELVSFTMHVPVDVVDVKDFSMRINVFLFGWDNGLDWTVRGHPVEMADVERVRDTQITLQVERRLVTTGLDPETKKERDESIEDWNALPGPARANVTAETNRRYYERSGETLNTAIKKGEDAKASMWNQALVDVENDKRALQALPPAIKQLLGTDSSIKPQDYQHLLRIAEKLKRFTPEDLAVYRLLEMRATSDLDLFEHGVDMFLARRDELLKALDAELKKHQNAAQPDTKKASTVGNKSLDDASLAAMSESDRYDLARQKTAELTEAQLNEMISNPGQTAKGFAKGALLLNTPETFEQIGKDLQEAAQSDANAWARWAAGTGAGAKLSGWLAALAGVLFVASYLTGVGEVATLGAIATAGMVMLGSTIALSFTESELRIKAASQATTVEEFERNSQLAAAARANAIVSLGFVVIAALLHFTAKALFPKTMAKLGTAIKNFRERVRLKGSIYQIKPGIVNEMASLKSELKTDIEAAKKDSADSAGELVNLSTEEFAEKLDKGTGILDQSKLPPEQRVNYGELIKTSEGKLAVEAYHAKVLEALKTDVPAEIDRIGADLNGKIDAFLKDVDAAKNHDELAAAADKVGDSLTAEAFNRQILEQKERITSEKQGQAAAEAHQEALGTIANETKPRIVGEMGALKSDLKVAVEAAKNDTIATAGQIANLTTVKFGEELDQGAYHFDQSRLPLDQQITYANVATRPDGISIVEAYRAKLLAVLRTEVPVEIDRVGASLNDKIDAYLKEVDAARSHEELLAASGKVRDQLTAQEFKKQIAEQKQKITDQKLETASAEAHKESLDALDKLPPGRIKEDVYVKGPDGKDIGQADVIEIDDRGIATFVEQKSGESKSFDAINRRTGQPVGKRADLIARWAENQILEAGKKKADAILRGTETRATKGPSPVNIELIRGIRTIRFEIQGDSADLQTKVEEKLIELRTLYPMLCFEAVYGVSGN